VAPPPPAEEPAPPPPPKPEPVVEAPAPEPLALPGPVVFARGSDKLSPESEPALKQVVAYMSQEKEVTLLRIEGHTDNLGLSDQNQRLSEARALAVAGWLVSKGVDCKRLVAVGFGDTRPLVDNIDDESRSKNRRTMFINAAIDGKQIGADPTASGNVAGDPCKR
jgi:OOP family OmpA-OmpF porin